MTYKDQFVIEVKCKGKILRVQDDIVRLPFGSEYSLYLKNLNSRRASVTISIDGEDVLDNQSLIVEANSSVELEGFLSGTSAKNRFKFINKTKEIQDHRGDKIDDGIIRVQFAYEKDNPKIKKTILHEEHHHHHHHSHGYPFHWNYDNWFSGDSTIKYGSSDNQMPSQPLMQNNIQDESPNVFYSSNVMSNVTMDSLDSEPLGQPLEDEGITVKGSECNQEFTYNSMGELEQAEVIIIRLKGISGNNAPVKKPVTIKTKLRCLTCGRTSNSAAKFCSNCGTFLE